MAAGVIVLAAAHVAYWYLPRERGGRPKPGAAVAALLDGGEGHFTAWVPYPHQNLGFLASDDGDWRTGLSKLLGTPDLELPGFGPFALPPASELAVTTDRSGERFVVAARIYPLVALVARAAGTVASNPWLAGGEIDERGERYEVRWDGNVWMMRPAGGGAAAMPWPSSDHSGAAEEVEGGALARLSLATRLGPLPAGRYRIERTGGDLELSSATRIDGEPQRPGGGRLLQLDCRGERCRAQAVLGPGQGSLKGVPSAAVLARRFPMPDLPFQRLYRILGLRKRVAREGDWKIGASDRKALERGKELARELSARPVASGIRLEYEVDLDVVRSVAGELERQLEGVPLPRIQELERWRGAALVLGQLEGYDRWSFVRVADGGVRSRLWGRQPNPSG